MQKLQEITNSEKPIYRKPAPPEIFGLKKENISGLERI
jgi:hypothetical protein